MVLADAVMVPAALWSSFALKHDSLRPPLGEAASLFLVAIANLVTKKIATVYGVSFTLVLLALFYLSERMNARKRSGEKPLEEFNLDYQQEVAQESRGNDITEYRTEFIDLVKKARGLMGQAGG